MGQYTAALPLFIPMPSINTWLFSGSGQLMGGGDYEFPAQTFTIAISANGVVAEDTRLATGNSKLASPYALTITNGDTVVRYDGSEAQSVTLSAGPQGEMGPAGPVGPAGKSAYASAQDGGFTGTESQFNKGLSVMGDVSGIDTTVTQNSSNLITSGAVYSYIQSLDGNGVRY